MELTESIKTEKMLATSMILTLCGLAFSVLSILFPVRSHAEFAQIYNQYNSSLDFMPSDMYDKKLSLLSAAVTDDVYQDKSYNVSLKNAGFSNINFVSIGTDLQAMTAIKQFPAEGKRVIAIVFRGTSSMADAMTDLNVARDVFNPAAPKIEVHHGFMLSTKYFIAYEPNIHIDDVKNLDKIIDEKNPNDIFWISGHSLGGAVATLYTAKLKDRGVNPANIITYTFGAPAVGNDDFTHQFDNRINLHRVRNLYDPIPYTTYIARYLNSSYVYKQIGYQRVYDGKVDVTNFAITPSPLELASSLSDHSLSVYKSNLGWVTNNSITTATALQDSVEVNDATASDSRYYKLTLDTASNVTINTKPQTSTGSTSYWHVYLYDEANSNLLYYTFDRSSPAGMTRQIGLPAGNYYIRIFTNTLGGVPYNLTASATTDNTYEQEPNDGKPTATRIAFATLYTANNQNRSSGSDTDYYKFTLTATSNVTINTKSQSSTGSTSDWSVSLYDEANNNLLYYTFDRSSPTGITQQIGLPPGDYYIRIFTNTLDDIPYNLTVTAASGTIYERELNDGKLAATPVAFATQYTANIQNRASGSDVDYYKFTLSASSNISINTKSQTSSGSTNYWYVYLYDEASNTLLNYTFDRSSPTGITKQIGLPAGDYYIRIFTNTLKGIPYNLTITPDASKPVIDVFSVPATSNSLTVPVTFTASDNISVTGYLITTSATAPAAGATGWSTTAPSNYIFTSDGTKILYGWAKDAAGNISNAGTGTVIVDRTAPTLTVPAQAITTTENSITLSGTVRDSVTSATISITVDGQTYAPTVAADGSFSQIIHLATDKTYAVVVTATDQAGNKATAQRNIIKQSGQPVSLKGDVNNDNKIDIFDALLTLQYGLNLIPHDAASDANYLAHGDVAPLDSALKPKGDGKIDIIDALVILQRSVNLLSW